MVVTFLPYDSFERTAEVLSDRHLGKQRVEAFQILNIITGRTKSKAWANHPATISWRKYPDALAAYLEAMILEWVSRGKKNTMEIPKYNKDYEKPWWLGWRYFHHSHRMMLLRKNPFHYGEYFEVGLNISKKVEKYGYIWPSKPKDMKKRIKDIAADIPENLIDPIYCPRVTRAGNVCGTLVKDRKLGVCGIHKPRAKKTVKD